MSDSLQSHQLPGASPAATPHRGGLFGTFTRPAVSQAAYLTLIISGGIVVLLASIRQLTTTEYGLHWLILAGLTMVGGLARLRLPNVPASFSISDSFTIAAALWFGPAAGALTVAIDSVVMSVQLARRQFVLRRLLFNATAPPLAMWLAAHAFFVLVGVAPLAHSGVSLSWLLAPLIIFVGLYFVLNTGLIAGAIALERRAPLLEIWRRHFMPVWLSYFGGAAIAVLLIALVNARPGDLIVFALIVPIPLILYAAFKHAMGRIEDRFTHLEHVNRMHLATVEALATAIEAKDGVTHDHIRRVQQYAVRLAQAIGVNDIATIKAIEAAALLHDTGKLAVPEHILNKPGKLTPAEFEKMKRHVDVGADILSGIEFPFPVVPIVRCHHEAWDGSGYPRGVRGTDIPIGARVLSVVDCFDALTSDRPYRRALSDEAAIDILMARRGTMYDPDVVDAFVQMCREREARSVPEPEVACAHAQINEMAAHEPSATVATMIDRDDLEETAASSAASANPEGEALRDLALLVTAVLQCDLPGATCALYLATDEDTLVVCHAVGPLAPALRGFTIAVNTVLSGWVAAHRETIINSDAQLDLDLLGLTPTGRMCMSTPLLDGGTLVGVLTVYTDSPLPITEDHGRTLQAMAPHVARIVSRSRGAEMMMPTPAMVRGAEPNRILVAM